MNLHGSLSVWQPEAEAVFEPQLAADSSTDVCIIGAGIAGMSAAYLLSRAGKSVIVLDAGKVGSGETSRTTAHLTCAIDDRFYRIEKWHGEAGSRLAAESHTAAIDRIEEIVSAEGIQCEFERVRLPGAGAMLEPRLCLRRKASFLEVRPGAAPSGPDTGAASVGGVPIPRHLWGWRRRSEDGDPPWTRERRGTRATVRTHGPPPRAGAVRNTSPRRSMTGRIHTAAVAYRPTDGLNPRGHVPGALYWDTGDPYHYVRLARRPATPPRSSSWEARTTRRARE
jgi:glycine/D-amino acid oxidase-like deaminating enzyme